MADDDTKKTPWGDALAPFERDAKTIWIDLGPVWQGEGGSLQLTLHVEPLHWRAHAAERRIVIKKRDERDERPPANTNTSRRGSR
jgi:hypothetical protein